MGTEKRERQKANRAKRQLEEAQAIKSSTLKRNVLRWGAAVVAAMGAVVLIAWISGAFDGDDDTTGSGLLDQPVVTAPLDTTVDDAAATETTVDDGSQSDTPAATDCPATDGSESQQREFESAPPMCIDVTKTYTAEIVTNLGEMTVEFSPDRAPLAVNNFVTLARYHYFDGTECHRIIPGFVAQCGDPTATGSGGPGYRFDDELPAAGEYEIGSLAMANSGPNTNGSQFFVITGERGAALPPQYTLFGKVIDGLDTTVPALDAAGNPNPSANGVPPLEQVIIETVTITES